MKIVERNVGDEHSPELEQLLLEVGEACDRPKSGYPSLPIVQFLYLCRYRDHANKSPATISPKHLPWPNPILGSKLSKHDGTEIFQLIDELASASPRCESGDLYLNSTVAAAINKLCCYPKKKKWK